MDIQTRKLNLITYLAHLQDDGLFDKIEEYIFSKLEEDYSEFVPFNGETLISRIEKSEDDFQLGRFKSQEDLEH